MLDLTDQFPPHLPALECEHPPLKEYHQNDNGKNMRFYRGVKASDVAYHYGHSFREQVWFNIERPICCLGAARSGKGYGFIVGFIIESPGAVITTSTRVDNYQMTAVCRAARGPIEVFNLDGEGGLPHTLRWAPLEFMDNPAKAAERAVTLVRSTGFSGGQNEEWATTSELIVQALLLAGALQKQSIGQVAHWAMSPRNITEPMNYIIQSEIGIDPRVRTRWNEILFTVQHDEPKMQGSKWLGVGNAFKAFSVPAVRNLLDVKLDDPTRFKTDAFLNSCGTVYMIGRGAKSTSHTSGTTGLLYSMFLDSVTDAAHELSQRRSGRLDPPLTLVLDELANIHPWAGVARMASAGSGEGIQLVAVFQNRKQAVTAYGEDVTDTIWSNSLLLRLQGEKDADDLAEVSRSFGTYEAVRESTSRDSGRNSKSTSISFEQRPVVDVDELRRLGRGNGLIQDESSRLVLAQSVGYPDRAHGACIRRSVNWHKQNQGKVLQSQVRAVAAPVLAGG